MDTLLSIKNIYTQVLDFDKTHSEQVIIETRELYLVPSRRIKTFGSRPLVIVRDLQNNY